MYHRPVKKTFLAFHTLLHKVNMSEKCIESPTENIIKKRTLFLSKTVHNFEH